MDFRALLFLVLELGVVGFIVGFIVYLILKIPMPDIVKQVICVIVAVAMIVFVIDHLGIFDSGPIFPHHSR